VTINSIRKIDAQISELPPESSRYKILVAVRSFRASWVELGRLLHEMVRGGDFREWGYDSFEVYCARELGIKMPTVHKLMLSYSYLNAHAKDRLQLQEKSPFPPGDVPDYQTVALLDRVQKNQKLSAADKAEFHRRAFAPWEGEGEPFDETQLRKEIRSRIYDADATAAAPLRTPREVVGLKNLARKLREQLANSNEVPEGLKSRLEEVLCELEEIE
jgi:hypothetical protein